MQIIIREEHTFAVLVFLCIFISGLFCQCGTRRQCFPESCQEMKTQGISIWVDEDGLLLLKAVFEMAGQWKFVLDTTEVH